jgi:hypothetical protein
MKIILGYFNAKVGREYIFTPTIWNGSWLQAQRSRVRFLALPDFSE